MSDGRTLKPTAKRRQEAKQQGRVAASGSLVGSISWLGLAALTSIFGAKGIIATQLAVETLWSRPIPSGPDAVLDLVRSSLIGVGTFLLPLLLMVLGTAILGRIAQVGFLWLPGRILPQADRILPSGARLADQFSMDKVALGFRGFAIFLSMGIVLGASIWYGRDALIRLLVTRDLGQAVIQFASQWGLQIASCLFLIGLLDYAFQLYRFELGLRMTPEELRSEIEAVQENPQVTAGRRGLRQELQRTN